MSKEKGTSKTGGRAKGTPNKVTTDLRKWVECLIDKNLKKMERDLKQLEPKERLMILEKLMQYSIPKQQSISVEAQIQAEYTSLEKLLSVAPDEAVKEITERVIRLNNINSKKDE
jgi:hypothetical protein